MLSCLLLAAAVLTYPAAQPGVRLHSAPRGKGPGKVLIGVIAGVLALISLRAGIGVVLAGGMILGTGWWAWQRQRRRKAKRTMAAATASIVGQLCRDLAAGASMASSVRGVAADLPATTPPELKRAISAAARQVTTGSSGARLLTDAHPTCTDLRRAGRLWAAAESRGISLSRLLGQLQRRIDAELRHATATEASLQGPQSTALVLTLLPLAGIGMGTAMGAAPIPFLATNPLGNLLLVLGVALACAGFMWVQLIAGKAAGSA